MSVVPWPVMSLEAVDAALTAAGAPFEMEEVALEGRTVFSFRSAPPTLRDSFLAGRAHGAAEFIVYQDERVTFEAFSRAVLRLAAEFQALGVVKGDRVAIAMRNLPEWPVAFFASVLTGAIATPLNAWWTEVELAYALRDCGARIAVLDDERWTRLRGSEALDGLDRVFVCRSDEARGAERLEAVVGHVQAWSGLPAGAMPAVDLQPEDDATIFYTSGTSGAPKGVLGTHRNNGTNLPGYLYSATRALLRRGETLPDASQAAPQRSTLVSIPFFHTTGCQTILVAGLASGSKLVLMHHFEPREALDLIERERINGAGGVPAVAWQLLEQMSSGHHDLSSLDSVSYGGGPAAPELARRLGEAVPGSQLSTGWGMTETSAMCTHHTGEDYLARPDSCGLAPPVCALRIVGPSGETLPVGEVGELWAYGPNIAKGYWNKPEATARTFVDGWVRTGDIARLDQEGFCYIVDRAKDIVIRGGENIASIEVENTLYAHPAVIDAGVVGRPHPVLGEEPVAVVTLADGVQASEADLQAFCRDRIAAFKTPVRILFSTDRLPRNANGKLVKSTLRSMFG